MAVERKSSWLSGIIKLVIGIVLFFMMGPPGFGAVNVGRLRGLGISFPAALECTYLIAPATALILWLVLRLWSPIPAFVAAIIVYYSMMSGAEYWANHQVEEVKVKTSINPDDLIQLEGRLGFKILDIDQAYGDELWIARVPGHALQLTNEVSALESIGHDRRENSHQQPHFIIMAPLYRSFSSPRF